MERRDVLTDRGPTIRHGISLSGEWRTSANCTILEERQGTGFLHPQGRQTNATTALVNRLVRHGAGRSTGLVCVGADFHLTGRLSGGGQVLLAIAIASRQRRSRTIDDESGPCTRTISMQETRRPAEMNQPSDGSLR